MDENQNCICCDPGERCRGFCKIDEREMIRNSDLYSPTVKRVMERFWKALDARQRS